MTKECTVCDGTGSVCGACSASIMDCNCGPDQEPTICDACSGSGDAPTEAADEAMLDAILSTSDADAIAGRWNKPKRT